MILLALYFVFVVLLATSAVWIYRNLPWRRGFKESLVGRSETYPRPSLRAQQGFISLPVPRRQSTQGRKRRRERVDGLRSPWGW
ncbi:MAG: hypothetical protein OQJ84_10625 [Xanthomonadales bacterium]|nr:hypothetical protein [Xanthomonadales bacterium]